VGQISLLFVVIGYSFEKTINDGHDSPFRTLAERKEVVKNEE
jgi:hypothetical protein